MNSYIKSTNPNSRIVQIDVLRGFALFGVLLVNVFGFNSSFFDFGGFYGLFTDSVNSGVFHFMINYAADKFIALFSFLFGIGFSIMYLKYQSNEKQFFNLYLRRLLVLMVIGIIHIVFFWAGDILFIYSIVGIILLLSRKLPSGLLLAISIIIFCFPVIYIALGVVFPFLPNALSAASNISIPEVVEIYSKGSVSEVFMLRLNEYYAFRNLNIFYYTPKIFSLFVMGYLFYKHKFLEKINLLKGKYFILGIILFVIGMLLNTYTVEIVGSITGGEANIYNETLYTAVFEIASIFLSGSYLFVILVLSQVAFFKIILKPLKYAGRMSLTNYLVASVFFSLLMYSYGFGKFGSFEPWQLVLFAVVFFAVQILISQMILKHFKYGPMEWVWRKLTYLNW
jgi:uncharacterized protein